MEHAAECIEADEVGYLLLDDCSVVLLGDSGMVPRATWIDVSRRADHLRVSSDDDDSLCHRGELIVQPSSCDSLELVSELFFDGTMSDICHANGCCPARGNRSDAALMVGLAHTCEGHIRIERFQLLVRPLGESNEPHGARQRAALVITFSIPSLAAEEQSKSKRVSKALPSSVQLLYSMLRSDWDYLGKEMIRLQDPIRVNDDFGRQIGNDALLGQERIPLFPPKLSLEELYIRIRGSSNQSFLLHKGPTQNECVMTSLPEDVLVTHLAPYLRAKSLDSLRCSCTHLHLSLRAVVPGLKLRLFKHQITSLDCMRRREIQELSEDKSLAPTYPNVAYGGDMHRALTGGASVCMESRTNRQLRYRVDQQFGKAFVTAPRSRRGTDEFSLARKSARGGFLCDEPGLGKSITVLSLILQTFGLQSKTDEEERLGGHSGEFSVDHVFRAYWKEEMTPVYQRPSLTRLLKAVERSHPMTWKFYSPMDPIDDEIADYFDVVENPICFQSIYSRINTDSYYSDDFTLFEADLKLCFENAILYYPMDHELHVAATELISKCDEILRPFKADQVRSAKKSFSNATAKPNSSIAAILENRAKAEHLDSLLTSKATLLVVPGYLLNHWEEQINMHLDLSYCTNGKEPLIFSFTGNDSTSRDRIGDALTKCNEEGSHCPLIFIDKSGTKKLPHERFLSLFSIVITTTQRFTNEWKNGSFADELKQEDGQIVCSYMTRNPTTQSCSLLKIHWTRLIVDEGHAMGRGKLNSAILFASWISAQRRWVMTGTPTPQTVAQSGLSNIHSLLHFLQHEFFTSRLDGDRVWRNAIVRSWNEGDVASFFRLRALLSMLMMRHTKLDIEELPPPRYTKRCAHLSVQETKAYNTLVCAVQTNLLVTSMEGETQGWQDSLLHRSQAKFAKEALGNLRLACLGGTRVIPTVTKKAFDETIDLLISHRAHAINITLVENYLHRAAAEEFTSCMNCGIQLNTMLLMPCAHLVCTECVAIDTRSCPVCDLAFDVDDFQLLQPGLVYEWAWNVENGKKSGKNDPAIINDEVMDAGDVPADGNDLAGHVPMRPGILPLRRRRKPNDGHQCEYTSTASHGKCLLCLEEHDECVMIVADSQCQRCYRKSEACPDEESKFFYVINKLETLFQERSVRRSIASDMASSFIGETIVTKEPRRLKAIIFSQFRRILDMIGHRLLRRFGAGCMAEYWGKSRSQELMKFSKSNDCFCMLLGKDGSEGLDLSFVTHIFFLEEVWDKSLESQAVARAWRMGASGHVEVETLIAKDSVESLMADWEKKLSSSQTKSESGNSSAASAKEFQEAKQNFLLKNVKLIKPSSELLGSNKTTKRKFIEQGTVPEAGTARVRFADV